MNGIGKKVKGDTSQIAKTLARQLSQEPLEMIKEGTKQVTGEGTREPLRSEEGQSAGENQLDEKKMREQTFRHVKALEREIEDIHISEEQEKERKAVLAERQKEAAEATEEDALVQPTTKRKRGLMAGFKGKVKDLTGRVEKRLPSSS